MSEMAVIRGGGYQERSEPRIPSIVVLLNVMFNLGVRWRRKALCLSDDTGQAYRMYSPKSHRENRWPCVLHASVQKYSFFAYIQPILILQYEHVIMTIQIIALLY